MAIRAQPVKSVFQRMPRLVREIATMTGKRFVWLPKAKARKSTRRSSNAFPIRSPICSATPSITAWKRPRSASRRASRKKARSPFGAPSLRPHRHRSVRRRRGINRPRVREIAVERADPGGCAPYRRRDRQSDFSAGLLDRDDRVRHFRPRRRHGCRKRAIQALVGASPSPRARHEFASPSACHARRSEHVPGRQSGHRLFRCTASSSFLGTKSDSVSIHDGRQRAPRSANLRR